MTLRPETEEAGAAEDSVTATFKRGEGEGRRGEGEGEEITRFRFLEEDEAVGGAMSMKSGSAIL